MWHLLEHKAAASMKTAKSFALVGLVAANLISVGWGFVTPSPRPSRIETLQQTPTGKNGGQQQPDPVEAFMENASARGADKVRAMSIEERTRRAMLAEAVEDRIFSMYDDLEGLLKDGVPASNEDRDEIKSLAQEIKASQSQYENLVSGEPSAMLGTINDIGSDDEERSDSSKRSKEQDEKDL